MIEKMKAAEAIFFYLLMLVVVVLSPHISKPLALRIVGWIVFFLVVIAACFGLALGKGWLLNYLGQV